MTHAPSPLSTDAVLAQTQDFWRGFYARTVASGQLRHTPSPFAQWCLQTQFKPGTRILELGCGNGRDSFAFLHHGLPTVAVDGCEMAIADNRRHYQQHADENKAAGEFHALNFIRLEQLGALTNGEQEQVNTLYTRFVLHAIPEVLEDTILTWATEHLPQGTQMWHEFRTLRDPMMREGEHLSANERLTDHYRRYLDPDVFRAKLKALGWEEVFFVEADGLAKFGEQDPVVARVGVVRRD